MSFLEIEITSAMAWFFIGIFAYKIISKLINYGMMIELYREIILASLNMLRYTDETFTIVNDYNFETDREKHNESLIIRETWRNMALLTIKKSTPAKFSKLVDFDNWREAMAYLEKGEENVQ